MLVSNICCQCIIAISVLCLPFSGVSGFEVNFEGKVVLITGAGSGIGATTAIYFARAGAKLSLVSRSSSNLRNVAMECSINSRYKPHIFVADLTNEQNMKDAVEQTIKKFSKLDILVNNAGILERGPITNTSLRAFDRVFNINVRAMYGITMHAAPYLIKTRGSIINVSSLVGIRPFKNILAYSMSKAAVDQFTKCLALELGLWHVRVNSVNPGLVDTGIHVKGGADQMWYDKYVQDSHKNHPLRRIATVDDVAKAILLVASDKASFTTGMNFPVDGGRNLMT